MAAALRTRRPGKALFHLDDAGCDAPVFVA
jgi:hypothetical protein